MTSYTCQDVSALNQPNISSELSDYDECLMAQVAHDSRLNKYNDRSILGSTVISLHVQVDHKNLILRAEVLTAGRYAGI